MMELNDNPELIKYSTAVLHILSAVSPPREMVEIVADTFISTIRSSSVCQNFCPQYSCTETVAPKSWKTKLNGLPILIVFFYKNLIGFSEPCVGRLMDTVISCLGDENVEVREMAAKVLSGLLRCSQRRSITPLRVSLRRFRCGPGLT